MIKAVLFDMDGVLVDSEEFISKAAIEMFSEYGIKVKKEDFSPFIGAGENKYLGGVAEKYGLKEKVEVLKQKTYSKYGEIVKGKLVPLKGAQQFIALCKSKGLKIAVASSADKIKVNINLNESGLGTNTFDAIVNGLEVKYQKPSPEIFLLAADKLALSPKECLVIEDAINGVEAAKKAGCKCLALTTSFTKQELHNADWVAKNLANAPNEVLQF